MDPLNTIMVAWLAIFATPEACAEKQQAAQDIFGDTAIVICQPTPVLRPRARPEPIDLTNWAEQE